MRQLFIYIQNNVSMNERGSVMFIFYERFTIEDNPYAGSNELLVLSSEYT